MTHSILAKRTFWEGSDVIIELPIWTPPQPTHNASESKWQQADRISSSFVELLDLSLPTLLQTTGVPGIQSLSLFDEHCNEFKESNISLTRTSVLRMVSMKVKERLEHLKSSAIPSISSWLSHSSCKTHGSFSRYFRMANMDQWHISDSFQSHLSLLGIRFHTSRTSQFVRKQANCMELVSHLSRPSSSFTV